MKKLIPILILFISVIGWFSYQRFYVTPSNTKVIYGNVDIREVQTAFSQFGRIEEIYVKDGDQVKKGDLLAIMDAIPFQHQVALSQAKLAVAKAKLADLKVGPRAQEIEAARQEVVQISATLKNAHDQYFRQKDLIQSGSTSAGSLDSAQAHYNETNADLSRAKQYLSMLEEGTKAETLAIAEQEITVAETELAIHNTNLQDTQLYAPDNGVVLMRIVEPGSMVNAGSPVLSLSLRNPTYVRAYIEESMLGVIAPGDEVSIATDSSNHRFKGTIGFISPKAEFTPKSVETPVLRTSLVYRIRIVVTNEDKGLNQGQPVTISL